MEVQRIKMNENGTLFGNFFSDFDRFERRDWMEKNWSVSLYGVGLYLAFIYFGQEMMKNRKPFDLRKIMAVWNFILAIFSISACLQIIPEFVNVISSSRGFYKSVCSPCDEISDASVFWGYMFTLSKMLELGDTVFLILRKRPLIFLHWYHHISVLLYTWYSYADEISPARWFIVVNFFIHSIMYSYYGLRSIGVWVPKSIAMTITLLQLSQMVLGVVVNVYAYRMKTAGKDCAVGLHHLNMALGMYASYFLLFAHFFYRAYFTQSKAKRKIQ